MDKIKFSGYLGKQDCLKCGKWCCCALEIESMELRKPSYKTCAHLDCTSGLCNVQLIYDGQKKDFFRRIWYLLSFPFGKPSACRDFSCLGAGNFFTDIFYQHLNIAYRYKMNDQSFLAHALDFAFAHLGYVFQMSVAYRNKSSLDKIFNDFQNELHSFLREVGTIDTQVKLNKFHDMVLKYKRRAMTTLHNVRT